jgi:hypothetical protein
MILKTLQAKHWQVFLILFGIPLGIHLFITNFIFNTGAGLNLELLEQYFAYLPFIILFISFSMGAWYWSIGIGLQKIIPPELQLNVKRFKVFLFIPAVYLLCFLWIFAKASSLMFAASPDAQSTFMFDWFPYIMPLHLFSMCCILYCIYFTARTIKTAELQRVVKLSDCTSLFFSLWVLPFGIWTVQPLINKLIATHDVNPEDQKSSFLLLDDELF